MLLTQVQPGTVCRVSAIQRTPEHIASLLLPCGFKRSTNQQPGEKHIIQIYEVIILHVLKYCQYHEV